MAFINMLATAKESQADSRYRSTKTTLFLSRNSTTPYLMQAINHNPQSSIPIPGQKSLPGPYKVHKPLRRFPRGYMISALRNKPTVMPIAI